MTGNREQIVRSNHEGHKKRLSGFNEARLQGDHNRAEQLGSLQSRFGNRAVTQLLGSLSTPVMTSTSIFRQSAAPTDLPLQTGSRGAAVVQAQQSLIRAGYSLGSFGADGIFGRVTGRAVRRFQHDHQLPETRIVDAQTWAALLQAPATQTARTTPPAAGAPQGRTRTSIAAPAGEAELAQKIVADIRSGGIEIAVYAYREVRSKAEFERQATQFAVDHQAIGLARGAVQIGAAMEMTGDLSNVIQNLIDNIGTLLQRHPDLMGGQSVEIPVRTLAIFTHGSRTGIQAGRDGRWISDQLVPQVAPFLSATPRVLFFACSTAGTPARGMPYAEAVRMALQAALEQRYGTEAGVAPEVWGHTTAGHTTANKMLVGFGGGPSSTGGDSLIGITGQRLAEMAVAQAGRTGTLSDSQQQEVERRASRSMQRVLQATTGKRDATQVFIREVPQIGIERVWRDLSTQASDDFSDLGLTPEATERVRAGLREFQARFPRQLSELEQYITRLPAR
jgi:peptidoglycan hydrolase-like protein with peptidoglycan-binding domain